MWVLFSLRNNVFLFDFENVELLSMLSEDAKLRDLSERIRDVSINERNGLLIITGPGELKVTKKQATPAAADPTDSSI